MLPASSDAWGVLGGCRVIVDFTHRSLIETFIVFSFFFFFFFLIFFLLVQEPKSVATLENTFALPK